LQATPANPQSVRQVVPFLGTRCHAMAQPQKGSLIFSEFLSDNALHWCG
jgi:hypothetical protein